MANTNELKTIVEPAVLPNNVTRTQTYDALLRSTIVEYRKNTTSQKKFEYVYNLADYRLLEKRHHASGTGDNYDLDSIYRSVTVKAGVADPVAEYNNPGSQTVTSTTGVTYDAAQSRSQVIVTAGGTPTTTNYTTDSLNFYTAVGGTTHVRDANGNLKDDGSNLYDYDYRNQLVRIRRKSDMAVIGTYDYDGICRRTAKSTGTGTISFFWIGLELAMEYDGSGLFSRRHQGAGFDEVVSAYQRDIADLDQDGSTADYVPLTPLYDGAYDCIGVLDHTGAIAEAYHFAYDGTLTITNPAGGVLPTTALGWQQGYGLLYRDAESGLVYAVHRYYDPSVGRFTTEDPSGRWFDPGALGNGLSWSGNRYRNGWDPTGDRDVTRIVYSNSGTKEQKKANIIAAIAASDKKSPKEKQIGPWLAQQLAMAITEGTETAKAIQLFKPWPVTCTCGACHWEFINVRYFTILPDDADDALKAHEEDHHDLFDAVKQQYVNEGRDGSPPTNKNGAERTAELDAAKAWVKRAHDDLDSETKHGKKPRTSTTSAIASRTR